MAGTGSVDLQLNGSILGKLKHLGPCLQAIDKTNKDPRACLCRKTLRICCAGCRDPALPQKLH